MSHEAHHQSTKAAAAIKRKNKQQVDRLGTGSIPRLIVEFSIPAIAGVLVNAAYNVIDSIFLGQAMGEIGLSATTVAMPIMTVFMAIAMMVGAGGNAFAALKLGEGDRGAAERSLGNTVTLSLIIWVIVAVAASIEPVMDFMLTISSATEEVRPYAARFLHIICLGFIFQCIGFGVNNFIRTCGAPNRALMTMVIGAVSCALFNYVFVIRWGMGVTGSALATITGQALSCISVLWYFLATKGVALRLRRACMRPIGSIIKSILTLGLASFFVQIGHAVLSFFMNMLLVKYGSIHPIGAVNALATIGVVMRITMLTFMPLVGIAIAIQPILGFNYGAKLFKRVRQTWLYGMLAATSIAVFMWAIVNIWTEPIINLFGIYDEELVSFTVFALRVQILMMPIVGAQVIGSNYFQATGQPLKATILTLSRQILFLLPLMFFLPVWLPTWTSFTGLDALYIATPVSDCFAIVLTAIFVIIELRRFKRLEASEGH